MSNTEPLVTIVMATHNRAKVLDEIVLPTIEKSTYSNYEIVIVNDASSDATEAVLKDWTNKRENIRSFKNTRNNGASHSRNKGLENARGEIIVLMDDDVIIEPDAIEYFVNMYLDDPALMAAWGSVIENGKHLGFGCGSLWSLRRNVVLKMRFDVNLRYFNSPNNDEHELARRIQKLGYKIGLAPGARANNLRIEAKADHHQYSGLGGDLNYLYEQIKQGSIVKYYFCLIRGCFLIFSSSLEKDFERDKYRQATYSAKRMLIFLREKRFRIALFWFYYVTIDIPIRAKIQNFKDERLLKY